MNNDAKERLREYVENDDIYTEYKSGKCDMSDFDKFCIEHCKDIECLLNENQELKEQLEDEQNYSQSVFSDFQDYKEEASAYLDKIENQQKEFIEWLENKIKYWEEQEQQWLNLGFMKFGGEANNKIIFKKILSKYKEIIGVRNE